MRGSWSAQVTVIQVGSVPGGIRTSCLIPCDVRLWPPAGSVRSVLVSLEVLRRMLKGSEHGEAQATDGRSLSQRRSQRRGRGQGSRDCPLGLGVHPVSVFAVCGGLGSPGWPPSSQAWPLRKLKQSLGELCFRVGHTGPTAGTPGRAAYPDP